MHQQNVQTGTMVSFGEYDYSLLKQIATKEALDWSFPGQTLSHCHSLSLGWRFPQSLGAVPQSGGMPHKGVHFHTEGQRNQSCLGCP